MHISKYIELFTFVLKNIGKVKACRKLALSYQTSCYIFDTTSNNSILLICLKCT